MVQAMQFVSRAQNSFWLTAVRPTPVAVVYQIPVVHQIAVVVEVERLAYIVARSNTSVVWHLSNSLASF